MRFTQWMYLSTLAFTTSVMAAPTKQAMEQLQVPLCLATHLSDYAILAENTSFRIVNVPSAEVDKVVLLADKIHCGRFVNVTDRLSTAKGPAKAMAAVTLIEEAAPVSTPKTHYTLSQPERVIKALEAVDEQQIMANLTHLTNYYNRSATSDLGVEAAQWLKQSFEAMAKTAGRFDTETYFVQTGTGHPYKQPSLVTVIGKGIDAPAIVIGAHMDTLDGRMPGAGDDGSGSASTMEMARILLNSYIPLKRPIYFIWYSAEERGLVGSQYVVKHFKAKHIPVKAVLQLDMTGFRNDKTDPTMWVFRDYTDDGLSEFLTQLINTYIHVPVGESECGYGCSDHASWMAAGIPAAFPCETDFEHHNRKIHSSGDTIDRLTPEHMVNFTKLGLAFAIELAS